MSASTIIRTALQMTRRGIANAERDLRRGVDALVELEKYLDDNSEAFTPVQNAVAARALRESSAGFKAANVKRELDVGKAAVARITTESKHKSLPPKSKPK
jgi:hypothetical protein